MKIKTLFLILSVLLFAACGSDDDNENASGPDNGGDTAEEELPDAIVVDSGDETPDEDAGEPESFCYSGGAILYEGGIQFKASDA